MSEITRYTTLDGNWHESESGDLVLYSDHAARLAELRAEVERLKTLKLPMGDDSPSQQARAWEKVYAALKEAGVESFIGTMTGGSAQRSVEFIAKLAAAQASNAELAKYAAERERVHNLQMAGLVELQKKLAAAQAKAEGMELVRRALMAIHERTNMAKHFVFLHTCGFSVQDLEAIYQGCRLCVSDDGSVLDAQWESAKARISAVKAAAGGAGQ